MKKSKLFKFLAIFLSVMMLLMTACSSGGDSQEPAEGDSDVVTITFGSPWWGESGRDVLWKEFAEDFHEAYPQYALEGFYISYSDFNDKIKTLTAAGDAPTLFYLQEVNYAAWLDAGYLAPIDDYFDVSAVYDDLSSPEAQDAVKHDGQYYGLTCEVCPYSGVIYNTAIFEADGIKIPTNADEYLAACKAMTKADGSQYGTIAANTSDSLSYIMQAGMPYILGFGGRIVDDEGHFTVNSKEFVEGVKYYVELATQYSPAYTDYSTQRSVYFEGKVGMVADGGYFVDWAKGTNQDLVGNLDVFTLPLKDPANPVDITYFGLSSTATEEEKQAAGAFLEWWCRPEVQEKWMRSCGYPVTMAYAATDEYRQENTWYQVYEDMAQYSVGLAVKGHEADSLAIRNIVAEYIVKCIDDPSADVQAVMDECNAKLEAEYGI